MDFEDENVFKNIPKPDTGTEGVFDIEKSPMREAYVILGATTPLELSHKYTEAEQELFISHKWDYDNPEQIQNKIKDILESVNENALTEEEREWRDEILWFWYHHAISVTDWKRDKVKMRLFSTKALEFQDNPNILTRVMYFLAHDQVGDAEQWLDSRKGDPDEETAKEMIDNYKKFGWLWPGR